jgi:hypothetical protein
VIDWSAIFFKLAHYCGFNKYEVWDLTLPQLNYYMKQCSEHIDFTIKVSCFGALGMFGGGEVSTKSTNESSSEEYKVATAEDMEWLASIL